MNKPTRIEAEHDLADLDQELSAMYEITKWAKFLSHREDVNAPYYSRIMFDVNNDIRKGNETRDRVVEYLKTL